MIGMDQAGAQRGKQLHGADGEELGTVDAVYVDDAETQATFAAVHIRDSDGRTSLVPLDEAELDGDAVVVPYDGELVGSAPQVDPGGGLSPEQEDELYAHYGLELVDDDDPQPHDDVDAESVAPAAGSADDVIELTRSEERLRVATEAVPAGRVRLRKQVVTEMETVQVPVRKERLVLEREPIASGDGTAAPAGDDAFSEDVHEIVLNEERVVVTTQTVPVERVRVGKEVVTEDVTVAEELRKEKVVTDQDGSR